MNIRNGLEMITPETYGFIYMTYNMVNGKKYIGQKIISRRGEWRHYLGSGFQLKKAIRKYGRSNFYKDIIDVAYNKDELNQKEKYWISKYDAVNSEEFYNIADGGRGYDIFGSPTGERYDEIKKAHSDGLHEYLRSVEGHHPNNKLTEEQAVEIIERLRNNECVNDIVKDYPHIKAGTIEKIRSHKTWSHLTDGIVFPDAITMQRIKTTKPIVAYDFYGNLVGKYESVKDAVRKLNIPHAGNIYGCLHKKCKTSLGYIWAYEDDDSIYDIVNNQELLAEYRKYYTPKRIKTGTIKDTTPKRTVLQFTKNGVFICKYESITKANDATNAGLQNISAVCKRKYGRKTAGGFIWRFEDDAEDMLKEVS